jgi:hypothetical protein
MRESALPPGTRLPFRPRWLNRWYARAMGYFWLPCPLCERPFGGHEWRDYDGRQASIPTDEPHTYEGICPSCTKAGLGHR